MSAFSQGNDSYAPAVDVLGCRVHAVTAPHLTDLLEVAVNSLNACIIAHHNLHSIYIYHRDAKLRQFFSQAKWTHADGMGVIFLGRAMGVKIERSARITYVDWFPMLLERAVARDWRIFYLGSKPGVADKGVAILRDRFAGLKIVAAHGYFDPNGDANETVLRELREFSPHILMVGMGMPRQEHWIIDNLERLGSMVVLPCGASIDYVAGEIPTPPRWAGRVGMEWFYRLVAEPRRLWKRYLVEPWSICLLMGNYWLRSQLRMLLRMLEEQVAEGD
jgi:N-acetylglucosaminyldiphosphoundecaprenol N-acetyl-beta-D-mannosaminyltransferase